MIATGKTNDSRNNRLAIDGGVPTISLPLPPMYPGGMRIGKEEEEEVIDVLKNKRLFRYCGPHAGISKVEKLEEEFAFLIGASFCAATISGTVALASALVGFAVGPGDEVIVPAYTWIATASAVLAVGAVPIIAEVDESLTLDPVDVEKKITPQTKAIIAVHMRGAPCNMTELTGIAQRHRLKLLEDVAQAVGGNYQGRRLGNIGDAGAFSLQFHKIITCGEGGLLTCSDKATFQRMLMYQDVHGSERYNIPPEQLLPSMNFRMPELSGAVALAQLRRLNVLLESMRQNKQKIKESVRDIILRKNIMFRTLHDEKGDTSVALIFYLPRAEQAKFVSSALNCEGLPTYTLYSQTSPDYHVYSYWAPIINKQVLAEHGGPWRWHKGELNYTPDMCPRTLDLLERAVHLDISPDLTPTNIAEIIEALHKVLATL